MGISRMAEDSPCRLTLARRTECRMEPPVTPIARIIAMVMSVLDLDFLDLVIEGQARVVNESRMSWYMYSSFQPLVVISHSRRVPHLVNPSFSKIRMLWRLSSEIWQ